MISKCLDLSVSIKFSVEKNKELNLYGKHLATEITSLVGVASRNEQQTYSVVHFVKRPLTPTKFSNGYKLHLNPTSFPDLDSHSQPPTPSLQGPSVSLPQACYPPPPPVAAGDRALRASARLAAAMVVPVASVPSRIAFCPSRRPDACLVTGSAVPLAFHRASPS